MADAESPSTDLSEYVTRAEAALFLLRHKEPPIPEISNDGMYPDILEDEWYTKFVLAGIEMGMWEPDPFSKRVHPHKPITRGEYLYMMSAAFNIRRGGSYAYTDIEPDHPLRDTAGIAAKYKLFFDEDNPLLLRIDHPISHEDASKTYYTFLANEKSSPSQTFVLQRRLNVSGTDASGIRSGHSTLSTYMTIMSRTFIKRTLQNSLQNQSSFSERIQNEVLAATNAERIKEGLPTLKANKSLQSSAQKHAKQMSSIGYFSHVTPDGLTYIDRIKASGYTDVDPVACGCQQVFSIQEGEAVRTEIRPNSIMYEENICSCKPKYALGENLARGQLTAEEVVKDWMESPGHRRNMLEPKFTELGIGIFRDMWVQNFGMFEVQY
ncbi:CAP domain-containing protein [Candidatus Peregrinibacteria bacterium]|nr:CAP domain-containing protein [Candidatus Peregrinibacteria bacterium]